MVLFGWCEVWGTWKALWPLTSCWMVYLCQEKRRDEKRVWSMKHCEWHCEKRKRRLSLSLSFSRGGGFAFFSPSIVISSSSASASLLSSCAIAKLWQFESAKSFFSLELLHALDLKPHRPSPLHCKESAQEANRSLNQSLGLILNGKADAQPKKTWY